MKSDMRIAYLVMFSCVAERPYYAWRYKFCKDGPLVSWYNREPHEQTKR